ncbi:MAG: HAMP domain-containing sensor histidine kinase, partial [Ferruginibacter sp.]
MRLLNKSLRLHLVYAVVVLIIAIPVFYFAIESIVAEDVDENMVTQKKSLLAKLEAQSNATVNFLPEVISTDFEISPIPIFQKKDSLYTINEYDSTSAERLPYRILESNIMIKDRPYSLTLKNSLIDTEDLKERIVLIMGILLLSIIAGFYLINIYISKNTWKPFYSTLEKLHHFRVDKNEPLLLSTSDVTEFSDLNKALTSLALTNQQVYQSQKEFTENASHEIQTPLAILQVKLELLMQTTPLTAEQAALLTDAGQVGQKMSKLNKTLLLLSKIENHQFPETENIPLTTIVTHLLQQYKNAIAEKGLKIHAEEMGDALLIANPVMIEMLISNLLVNAIRHNIKNGLIKISFVNNLFTISNSGKPGALDKSKLFQRFQKQAAMGESLGLGLALAHQICILYGAEISYT